MWERGVVADRDITVIGRRSRRFYNYAQKWLKSEVEYSRAVKNGRTDLIKIAKSFVVCKSHRAAMYLTRHEIESGRPVH